MGSGRSLSSEKMAPAVALGNSGHDRSHIGRIFGCSMGFGLKYVKRYRETGSLKYKPGRGCPVSQLFEDRGIDGMQWPP